MQNNPKLESDIKILITPRQGGPIINESFKTFKGVGHELDSRITKHLETNPTINFVLGNSIKTNWYCESEENSYEVKEPLWASDMILKITGYRYKAECDKQIVKLEDQINAQNVFFENNNIDANKFLKVYLFGLLNTRHGKYSVFSLTEKLTPIKDFLYKKNSYEVILGTVKQVIKAVSLMHEYGFLHLDINHKNIMYRESDDSAVLVDFGIYNKIENYGPMEWKNIINDPVKKDDNFDKNLAIEDIKFVNEEIEDDKIEDAHYNFLTLIDKLSPLSHCYTPYELKIELHDLKLFPSSTFFLYQAIRDQKLDLLKKLDVWGIGLFIYDILYHLNPGDNDTLIHDFMNEGGEKKRTEMLEFAWLNKMKSEFFKEMIENKQKEGDLPVLKQQPTQLLEILEKKKEESKDKDNFYSKIETLLNQFLLYDFNKRPYLQEAIESLEQMQPMEMNSDNPIKNANPDVFKNSPFGKGHVDQNAGKPRRKSKKSKRKYKSLSKKSKINKTRNKTSKKTRKKTKFV